LLKKKKSCTYNPS